MARFCSCDDDEKHVIKRARTSCGMRVSLWSDGLVTTGLGGFLEGVGAARSVWGQEADLWAGWAVLSEASLISFEELPRAVRGARKAARRAMGAGLTAADWRKAMGLTKLVCGW